MFRLPLDRQLAILGPAGTGKTTTLVLRLRQKIDGEWLTEEERELIDQAAENGQPHAQSWLMFTPTDLLNITSARHSREPVCPLPIVASGRGTSIAVILPAVRCLF